jgi:predicted dehydrogenase
MMVGILGSGFGLYGYLPALINLDQRVNVLSKAKPIIEARMELRHLGDKVRFFDREEDLLKASRSIVYARTPDAQHKFILNQSGKFEHMFLEKPLTPYISQDQQILEHLSLLNQSFSVGYIFLYTKWFVDLEKRLKDSSKKLVEITWDQKFAKDWKANSSLGGGILKYYGIHYLSIIASLQEFIIEVKCRKTETELHLQCISKTGTTLVLKLNSKESSKFRVSYDSEIIYEENSPFANNLVSAGVDSRVPFLQQYILDSARWDRSLSLNLEGKILNLRSQIESTSDETSTLSL